MNNIQNLLIESKKILKKYNIDTREARLLLAHALEVKSDELIRHTEVSDDIVKKVEELVDKRISGIPFAYITGQKEFMRLQFKVDENVLIPRPETELLVEEVLNFGKNTILDMCTGSGCIAISIAYYDKNAVVMAVDVSENALNVAKQNAELNGVNVEFVQSDLFEKVNGKFDLIVSNPPYIKSKVIDTLDIEVRNEPHIALDGGENGLEFYEKIAKEAKNYLNENGALMFEIGYDQAQDVTKILKANGYTNIQVKKDLSGNDRVVVCEM